MASNVARRAGNAVSFNPQQFSRGIGSMRGELKRFNQAADNTRSREDMRKLYDPARQQGLGRKGEARAAAIEESRVMAVHENAAVEVNHRINRSPNREAIEQELEGLQEFMEKNPNTPIEAIEEYLTAMFNQYFPAKPGRVGYPTRYNNAYSIRTLLQQLYPEEEIPMRKVE